MSEGQGQADAPVFVVEGETVALGPLRREMVDTWVRWLNNLDMTRTLGNPGVYTREAEQAFFDHAAIQERTASFTIYERASGRPIGQTSLREIDDRHGTATFGIFIGEPDCWNRGFGTEATRLVLDYAFHVLGLHNVLLTVFSSNPRGQRAYEKAGFRVIGRRRGAHRSGQERFDVVLMDAVVTDFESPVLQRRIAAPQEPKLSG
jgi:RimJ/RimL family protein N-acetyltransferase